MAGRGSSVSTAPVWPWSASPWTGAMVSRTHADDLHVHGIRAVLHWLHRVWALQQKRLNSCLVSFLLRRACAGVFKLWTWAGLLGSQSLPAGGHCEGKALDFRRNPVDSVSAGPPSAGPRPRMQSLRPPAGQALCLVWPTCAGVSSAGRRRRTQKST